MEEEGGETAPLGVWIGLSFMAIVSFWCQATVTEERFVPALNVIADRFQIPDDVAGATLMAAGASSPELFSSFVALFITHTELGLGTIVGSEIFNQLIICAGAVYSAKSGKLHLDRAIVTREVGFYALAIVLLLWTLHDREPTDDDALGVDHIFISFHEALILFSGYILYVLVCANFDAIVAFVTRTGGKPGIIRNGKVRPSYGSMGQKQERSKRTLFEIPDMPFLKESSIENEPAANFQQTSTVGFFRTADGRARRGSDDQKKVLIQRTASGTIDLREGIIPSSHSSLKSRRSLVEGSLASTIGRFSDGASVRMFNFLLDTERPSDQHELHDLEINMFEERLSCFLWRRSVFYNKARFAVHGWHLSWFTFTHDNVYSVPERAQYEKHRTKYPLFERIEVDDTRLILKIVNPHEGKRDYYLLAPSEEIFKAVVKKCEEIMDNRSQKPGETKSESDLDEPPVTENADDEPSLTQFPTGASNLGIFCYFILFPIRLLMQFTIPDVRHLDANGIPTASLATAFLAVFSCLVWLIVGSYAMVSSLENLADLMSIPTAVVGVTVSAAGTSLPNYVASKVAAEKGFGNMAVSNAFGSNSFNIMVGLGLPWTLYTIFGTKFRPYHGLRNDGITESVVVLGSVLLVFVVIVLRSGFVLYKWHANLFFALYAAYLAYAIIPVLIE